MDIISEEFPLLQLPFRPKTLNFDEDESTFLIPAQIFIHDSFQRKQILFSGLVKIVIDRDINGNTEDKSTPPDSEPRDDCDSDTEVVKSFVKENNLSTKGIKKCSEFVEYIKEQSESQRKRKVSEVGESDNQSCHLHNHGNISLLNISERQSEDVKNTTNILNYYSECQPDNDSILESVIDYLLVNYLRYPAIFLNLYSPSSLPPFPTTKTPSQPHSLPPPLTKHLPVFRSIPSTRCLKKYQKI